MTTRSVAPPEDEVLYAQIVGIGNLSEFFGVGPNTPHIWRQRRMEALGIHKDMTKAQREQQLASLTADDIEEADHQLPPPDYPNVNGAWAWRRMTIVRWGAQTGRITEMKAPWLYEEARRFIPKGGYSPHERRKTRMALAR